VTFKTIPVAIIKLKHDRVKPDIIFNLRLGLATEVSGSPESPDKILNVEILMTGISTDERRERKFTYFRQPLHHQTNLLVLIQMTFISVLRTEDSRSPKSPHS
jgi:hypothetical protein